MIGLRKLFKVFGRGTIEFLPAENRQVLAYLRRHEGDVILCVANFSRFAQPAQLALQRFRGYTPIEMFGYTEFPRIGEHDYPVTLTALRLLLVRAHGAGRAARRPAVARRARRGDHMWWISSTLSVVARRSASFARCSRPRVTACREPSPTASERASTIPAQTMAKETVRMAPPIWSS